MKKGGRDFRPRWRRLPASQIGALRVCTSNRGELFSVMAFSQLTWRESLRVVEVCLTANQAKLLHLGLSAMLARSTLADALNARRWLIYHAPAMRLIGVSKSSTHSGGCND